MRFSRMKRGRDAWRLAWRIVVREF